MSESRDAWLAAALRPERDDARSREDCPAPERIWRAVHLELPVAERVEIIDHLAECPACAESWQLATELGGGQPVSAVAEPPRFAAIFNRQRYLSTAAALLLLVAGIAYMSLPAVTPIARDPLAGVLETEIPDGGVLPRDDFRLRWTSGPAGSRYDVVLTTADLTIVDEARGLQASEYRVPPERLAAVSSGTPLLIRVVGHAPDGTTLSSRTLEVSVR